MSFRNAELRASRAAMKRLANASAVFYEPGEISIEVQTCHFVEPYQGLDGGEVQVESSAPVLYVLEEDLPSVPEHDWEINTRNRWFQVQNPQPDGTGMIAIELEEIDPP